MNKRKCVYLKSQRTFSWLAVGALLCAGWFGGSFAGWKRVGLEGQKVSAITNGVDVYAGKNPIVVAAAQDSGIFSISSSGDSIRRYPRFTRPTDKPFGTVNALLVSSDGYTALAGTDSGLYGETVLSEIAPSWRRIPNLSNVPVTVDPVVAIANSDSFYCVATRRELYRSKNPFGYNSWAACSVSKWLPSGAKDWNFTSLTAWRFCGLMIGSSALPETNIFSGIILNTDTNQWRNVTCVSGGCVGAQVNCLTKNDNGKVFAATSTGIFYAVEFDTGSWYGVSPQFTSVPVRNLWVTYESTLRADEIYAATDSGVYILSPRVNSNKWTLSLTVKTYGVISVKQNGATVVYAATADGVWKYEPGATGVTAGRAAKSIVARQRATDLYSIDGRKIASETQTRRMTAPRLRPNVGYDSGLHIRAH